MNPKRRWQGDSYSSLQPPPPPPPEHVQRVVHFSSALVHFHHPVQTVHLQCTSSYIVRLENVLTFICLMCLSDKSPGAMFDIVDWWAWCVGPTCRSPLWKGCSQLFQICRWIFVSWLHWCYLSNSFLSHIRMTNLSVSDFSEWCSVSYSAP